MDKSRSLIENDNVMSFPEKHIYWDKWATRWITWASNISYALFRPVSRLN